MTACPLNKCVKTHAPGGPGRAIKLTAPSKYRAQPWLYAGLRYHSKREAAHAAQLDLLKKSGEILVWFPQVDASIIVNDKLICHYKVDFHVFYADGHEEWQEVKGMDTPVGRLKIKLFEACYPDRKLVVIR